MGWNLHAMRNGSPNPITNCLSTATTFSQSFKDVRQVVSGFGGEGNSAFMSSNDGMFHFGASFLCLFVSSQAKNARGEIVIYAKRVPSQIPDTEKKYLAAIA